MPRAACKARRAKADWLIPVGLYSVAVQSVWWGMERCRRAGVVAGFAKTYQVLNSYICN